jgi:hypothetical protein
MAVPPNKICVSEREVSTTITFRSVKQLPVRTASLANVQA